MADFDFIENFTYGNGALPSPWLDGKYLNPDHFEPMGVYSNKATILTDRTRPGPYATDQFPPTPVGQLRSAVAYAVRETRKRLPDCRLTWQARARPTVSGWANSYMISGPLIHVDNTNPLLGVCAWIDWEAGSPYVYVGYLGKPPEGAPAYLDRAPFPVTYTVGASVVIQLVRLSSPTPKVQVYVGPTQASVVNCSFTVNGTTGVPFASSLATSTLHGFFADGHLIVPTPNAVITNATLTYVRVRGYGADFFNPDPIPEAPAAPDSNFTFTDTFTRANSSKLGAPWINARDMAPCWDNYEVIGVYNNAITIRQDKVRQGRYQTNDAHPPANGEIYNAISFAAIETQRRSASVEVVWNGYAQHPDVGNQHVETAPLVKINPHSKHGGFGVWPSALYGIPALLIGCIGNPPELFGELGDPFITVAIPGGHTEGTPRTLRVDAEMSGADCYAKVYVDGTQVSLPGIGLGGVLLPRELAESTLHGIALDAHLLKPAANIPTTVGAHSVKITGTGPRYVKRAPRSLNAAYRRTAAALAGPATGPGGVPVSLATVRQRLGLVGSTERLGLRTLFMGGASTGDDALNVVRFRDVFSHYGATTFGNGPWKSLWSLYDDIGQGFSLELGAPESDHLVLPAIEVSGGDEPPTD